LGNTGSGTDHWRIASWSDGTTTEGGSSGSPLLDTQGRIIGQLHGGYASCTSITQDYYGKLGTSWTGGGTNATRLSNWLDPLGTGAVTLDGYDPNVILYAIDGAVTAVLVPEASYADTTTVVPAVIILNKGSEILDTATVAYQIDTLDPVLYNWTGSISLDESDTVYFPAVTLEVGEHSMIAYITVSGEENPENDSLIHAYRVDPFIPPKGPVFLVMMDIHTGMCKMPTFLMYTKAAIQPWLTGDIIWIPGSFHLCWMRR
jgi:lysyl endopeptidase